MEGNDEERKLKRKEEEEEEEREYQKIRSWGAGTDGQLGTGQLHDEHSPQLLRLPSLSSPSPTSLFFLSCGGAHVLALTSGGRVLSWGRGASGQLGHGDTENSPKPKLVMPLESHYITHVSAGSWNHSGFVSDSGSLFTCGDGSFGQLGHGDYKSHCSPVKVSYFVDYHVEKIACGMRHSLVLSNGHSADQVYAFGSGKRGQLGISKYKINKVNLPEVTCGLEGVKIESIAANGDHSAALSADGRLYTWGRGFPGNSDACCPTHLPTSIRFTKAALGWNYALLLTGNGAALMLGGNHHGVLSNLDKIGSAKHLQDNQSLIIGTVKFQPSSYSNCVYLLMSNSKEVVLEEVRSLEGQKVAHIAAGAEHSALVTENGLVMTWGWGEHGQLGLGDTCNQTSPQTVNFGQEVPNEAAKIEVYCGSGFTITIRTSTVPSRT